MNTSPLRLAPALHPPSTMPKKSHRTHDSGGPDAHAALVSMHADEPYLPLTEAVLRCHAKRRLFRALAQASQKPVVDWLFADPSVPFHHTPTLNSTLFEFSLAIRAEQLTATSKPPPSNSSAPHPGARRPAGPSVRPGDDILFVPARTSGDHLLGYTFGGLSRFADASRNCPLGDLLPPFPPHVVGRFAFDPRTSDLLFVVHGLNSGVSAIMHIRGDPSSPDRERNTFLVPGGNYGHRRLPGRLLTNLRIPEQRVMSMPRYQFSVTGRSSNSGTGDNAKEALAALERVLKGKFRSSRMCRDTFDEKSGEVLAREMREVEAEFDARDAVGMQVLRDLAVRTYFSYMSSVARESTSGEVGASSSARRT